MLSKTSFAIIGLVSLLLTSAAPTRQQQASEVTVVTNCINAGQVALTFDDGPYVYDADVMQYLGDSKVTFFLNGNSEYTDSSAWLVLATVLMQVLSQIGLVFMIVRMNCKLSTKSRVRSCVGLASLSWVPLAISRAFYAAGHVVASHGWSHAHSNALTLEQM
jgi:peptidoglycan/xylan/chitin deacetylase (PgdA/CDA1 family)